MNLICVPKLEEEGIKLSMILNKKVFLSSDTGGHPLCAESMDRIMLAPGTSGKGDKLTLRR